MGNVEREFFVVSLTSLTKIWAVVGCGLWAGLGLFSPWVGGLWDAHGEIL